MGGSGRVRDLINLGSTRCDVPGILAAGVDTEVVALIAIDVAAELGTQLSTEPPGAVSETVEQHIVAAAVAVDRLHRAERSIERMGPRYAFTRAFDDADLVVVGPRGRGELGWSMLGSLTMWLISTATCPWRRRSRRVGLSICVAGSKVDIIAAWEMVPSLFMDGPLGHPKEADNARRRFDDQIAELPSPSQRDDIAVRARFLEASPSNSLACADDADLLVFGARGRGATGSALLGLVSTWLLNHVERPMVVIPGSVATTICSRTTTQSLDRPVL